MSQKITIYHNPRCSKSRATLALLNERDLTPTVIEYLDQPPSTEQLFDMVKRLGVSAREIVRTGDKNFKNSELDNPSLSERELITALSSNINFLQRPIVIVDDRACIGRPPENVLGIL
ncbi:MAG: arsenate reductase (glutaredoxin) [Gammaproteobacteria bacterium]|nr:arsenate reductase (glutaredoxin) [Gammaproteobacteria bacterium]